MNIDPDRISKLLAQNTRSEIPTCPPLPGISDKTTQPAAVLIPILKDQGIWKMLFIKRTIQKEDRHSGQIAFPGGRFDLSDLSLERTALREASEEIGLDPDSVQILGMSCSMITVTGYEVTPFVGIISWPVNLDLSLDEVEKTLLIPLAWLVDPSNHRTELWQSGTDSAAGNPVIYFDEFDGEVLWGATAQITLDFLDLSLLLLGKN